MTQAVIPAASWASDHTASDIVRRIEQARSVVLLTHIKPDGDAVGSTLGLARAINLAAPPANRSGAASKAECWYAGPVPGWFDQIRGATKTRVLLDDEQPPKTVDPDLTIICDTGAWTQLQPFRGWLEGRADRTVVIDHHLSGDADTASVRLVSTRAAAACQVVAPICEELLQTFSCATLPLEVAEPLYLGLCTDTGWFRHSNVTPEVMRLAADLLEAGVNAGPLFESVEQQDRPSRLLLLKRALERSSFELDDRAVVLPLSVGDFDETGAAPGDSGNFHDVVKSIARVRVSAVLTEQRGTPTVTKVSMRSKSATFNAPMIDVNRVARGLGGGGHAQAAGARIEAPLAEAKAAVIDALRQAFAESAS